MRKITNWSPEVVLVLSLRSAIVSQSPLNIYFNRKLMAIPNKLSIIFAPIWAIITVSTSAVHGLTVPAQHFGAPCHFCECFITYTDRDVNQFTQPYQVLNSSFAYEATEDRCLAHCMNEEQCRLVVYGYVGGREVFACEFYQEASVRAPLYTPYTNIYIKRTSECKKSALGFQALETTVSDERTFKRKMRYLRLYQKFNFFGFG